MRVLAYVLLTAMTAAGLEVKQPCRTTIYAKVHAKDIDGGGFDLTPVCPAGMEPDKARMPKALSNPSSYGEAINAVQEWPCKPKSNDPPAVNETPKVH